MPNRGEMYGTGLLILGILVWMFMGAPTGLRFVFGAIIFFLGLLISQSRFDIKRALRYSRHAFGAVTQVIGVLVFIWGIVGIAHL